MSGFGQLHKLYKLDTVSGNLVAGDLLEARFQMIDDTAKDNGSGGFEIGMGMDQVAFAALQREASALGKQMTFRKWHNEKNGKRCIVWFWCTWV